MLEQILTDIQKADPEWNVVLLRYFNPIGAHKSGLIGENPNGIPNNLMPYITQVAVGKLKELGVFGNDYDTPDGTGVRDYIHVVDLAKGHVKAVKKLEDNSGLSIYNLGTGKGYSVLDIVKNFEAATGIKILTLSNHVVQVMLRHVILMRPKQRKNLAGKQSTISKICVQIPGISSRRIRTDTKTKSQKHIYKDPRYHYGSGDFLESDES